MRYATECGSDPSILPGCGAYIGRGEAVGRPGLEVRLIRSLFVAFMLACTVLSVVPGTGRAASPSAAG